MGLLGWIVLGLIAGSLAQRATGTERRGCLTTLLIGVLGAVIGGALFNAAGSHKVLDFSFGSLLVAFIGAGALCLVLKAIGRR
jgi:uncharacterized membrane protein YeaQ/YmgE (transglycosylase-associated protein family)